MKIIIVSPALDNPTSGNCVTADRWAGILRTLGHDVSVAGEWTGEAADILIALHARRSHPSVGRYHVEHPDGRLIVALTGTDLYRDVPASREAMHSLQVASRIVALQAAALEMFDTDIRGKIRVIYQSAVAPKRKPQRAEDRFDVCVLSHLREVKDPLRVAAAARLLPAGSKIRVIHAGRALEPKWEELARHEERENRRYSWVGGLMHEEAIELLASCRLFVLPSLMEGGANVIAEGVICGVPVLCSDISGNIGMLGRNYAGYFRVGDTKQLAQMMYLAETTADFLHRLHDQVSGLKHQFTPEQEITGWRGLIGECRMEDLNREQN